MTSWPIWPYVPGHSEGQREFRQATDDHYYADSLCPVQQPSGLQLFLQWRTWLDKSCGSGQSVRTMAQDLLNQFILGQHDALLLFASLNTWDSYMLRKLLVNFTCFLMYELSKIALDMCWPWDRSCQAHWVTSNYQNVIYQNNPRDTILNKPYLQMIPRKS